MPRYMPNEDGGGGACDKLHIVVLGKPYTFVAELFDVLRYFYGTVNGIARIAALDDEGELKGRQMYFLHKG